MDKQALLEPFYRRLSARDVLSQEERDLLAETCSEVRQVSAGDHIVEEGARQQSSTLLVSGFTARYNVLASGGRQITSFHVAGDFVDLQAFLLKLMDHGVLAMTRATLVSFPHAGLRQITERHPHLTRMLWLSTLLDDAIHRQWIVAKGRLSAAQHMANLFCEHFLRAQTVGLANGNSFAFPVTQTDFADAMGISAVHVNRTIQELRARGLVEWQQGKVTIFDLPGLKHFAEFDEAFLHLEMLPR